MQKHIVYVIRYSLLQRMKAWRLARQHDFETYKQKLFSPERLVLKEALFTRFTLPSLIGQNMVPNDCSRTILVLVSPELPDRDRRMLEQLSQEVQGLCLLDISIDERLGPKVDTYLSKELAEQGECIVSTVRLDDDDALAPQFEAALYEYMNEPYVGKTLTFSRGYELFIDSDGVKARKAQHLNLPKIALGLSYITQFSGGQCRSRYSNVFQLGNHDEVQRASEVINDKSFHAYIRVAYKEQDTEAEGFVRRESKGANEEALVVVQEKFPSVHII